MGFSPLADQILRVSKHSTRGGHKVKRIIVHHWAGTNLQSVLNKMVYNKNTSSVSYILLSTGKLIGSVDERYRPWTTNGFAADAPSVTVEVQNSTVGPHWKVSDEAVEKLTQLIVDLAQRHGWKQIRFGHEVRGHREFFATSCPGPYLWARLPAIAKEADRRLKAGSVKPVKPAKPAAKPAPSKKPAAKKAWPAAALKVGKKHTAASHKAWVKLMADVGYKDKSLTVAVQKWLRDRGYYSGYIDGKWLKLTTIGLQMYLRDRGFYKGKIDGKRGPLTIQGEFRFLNDQRRFY